MVDTQIASRGVRDDPLLEAMRTVPRERFVPPSVVEFAYEDTALPIEADQTISQPYVVAIMVAALEIESDDNVLEVGTGSGYAAAVVSRLAARVFTIERHRTLAESAERALRGLAYDNVTVRHGDGTRGWEEEAPFDAILVSAGGREVPSALREQLAPGGRMVIPVGREVQDLLIVKKRLDGAFSERNLGQVRFVPLIGTVAEAADDGEDADSGHGAASGVAPPTPVLLDLLRNRVDSFDSVDEVDLTDALDRAAGHRTVLLGEASHGTSEFYRLRARLTQGLIERGAADFVAVEADWPDAAHLDRYARGIDDIPAAEAPFTRFPRWMWANEETLTFLRWLRDFNRGTEDPDDRVGFFGLDLYSLSASIDAVLSYLEDVDPETAEVARARFACLTPWQRDPITYGRLATTGRMKECEDEVVQVLEQLLDDRPRYVERDGPRYMHVLQNARLVANAERYYRTMYRSVSASWNLRDAHMLDTLVDLLTFHGADSRAVVWAHNSHLGDASATDMGASGRHNLGQLCRERFDAGCYLVGMGTHRGTVMAADDWGAPGEVMDVRLSLPDSYERLSHDVEVPGFFLPLDEPDELRRGLTQERLQRAIGVVYRPETERVSHYYHASLPRQFDEWIFIDRTEALSPLAPAGGPDRKEAAADTYPFGV